MPIFEYKCADGHMTEELVMPRTKISDRETIICPKCKRPAYLIYSRTGSPILKEGSGGFYAPTKQ